MVEKYLHCKPACLWPVMVFLLSFFISLTHASHPSVCLPVCLSDGQFSGFLHSQRQQLLWYENYTLCVFVCVCVCVCACWSGSWQVRPWEASKGLENRSFYESVCVCVCVCVRVCAISDPYWQQRLESCLVSPASLWDNYLGLVAEDVVVYLLPLASLQLFKAVTPSCLCIIALIKQQSKSIWGRKYDYCDAYCFTAQSTWKAGRTCGYGPSFYSAIFRHHFILQGRMIKKSQVSRLSLLGHNGEALMRPATGE